MVKLYAFVYSLAALRSDEKGATAIEYGLLAALIAVVLITMVGALGTTVRNQFSAIVTGLGGQLPPN